MADDETTLSNNASGSTITDEDVRKAIAILKKAKYHKGFQLNWFNEYAFRVMSDPNKAIIKVKHHLSS